MKASTLSNAMYNSLSLARYTELTPGANYAMRLGGITTVNRAAMFLAQIGHESGSLRYQQEIAPPYGAAYPPYIGRTFIQITWSYNYRAFGQWCLAHHLLTDSEYFVKYPSRLADDRWAWLGAVWFWTTHGLNALADARDIYGATQRINGGYNNFADRNQRWLHCLSLGSAILPDTPAPTDYLEEIMSYYADKAHFEAAIRAIVRSEANAVLAGRLAIDPKHPHGVPSWFEHYLFGAGLYDDPTSSANHPGVNLRTLMSQVAAIKKKLGA